MPKTTFKHNLAHRKPDEVYCFVCDSSGAGVEFPLWPKSGYQFGRICADCDKKQADNSSERQL